MASLATGAESALDVSKPQVIFNLAAAGVGKRIPYIEMVEGNAGIVARVLQATNPETTRIVVHAGTWSQYSCENPERRILETDRMEPPTVYGVAKLGAELMGRAIASDKGVGFVSLRLFNVYGPGESKSRLIPYIAHCVATGRAADLTSGEQVRDFVHVDDVTSAFEAAAGIHAPEPAVFNIATGVGTSVREVARLTVLAAGGDEDMLRFDAKSARASEPQRVVGDASAFREATEWCPRIAVPDGVHTTVQSILGTR